MRGFAPFATRIKVPGLRLHEQFHILSWTINCMSDAPSKFRGSVGGIASEHRPTESPSTDSLIEFLLLPAIAMSLGWGLRGTIGGGPVGAMIPGAIVTLCLCHLLGWKSSVGIVAAIGTVGVGLGGQETYGQTIGFLREAATIPWGLTGLAIKGAMWGLSGGVLLGLAFMHSQYRWWEIALGLMLMLAATVVGREFVDKPKLVYFSNVLDKPREELWVGLTLGALALLIYLMTLQREKISSVFAWCGMLAGAAGFGGGSLFLAVGLSLPQPYRSWQWWKMMEFTFGALYGLGLGAVAFRLRDRLREVDRRMSEAVPFDPLDKLPVGFLIGVGLTLAMGFVPSKLIGLLPLGLNHIFSMGREGPYEAWYSFLGVELILLSLLSNRLAWHVALSTTICGFLHDFLNKGVERHWFDAHFDDWRYLLILTLPVVAVVSLAHSKGGLSSSTALLFMTWVSTPFGLAKMIMPHEGKLPSLFVACVFIGELLLTTGLVLWGNSKPSRSQLK